MSSCSSGETLAKTPSTNSECDRTNVVPHFVMSSNPPFPDSEAGMSCGAEHNSLLIFCPVASVNKR